MKKALLFLLLCAAVFGAINLTSGYALKEKRKAIKVRYRLNVVPLPAPLLRLVAGEFKGMAANYLLLQAAAFLGSNQKLDRDDYDKLALLFEQSVTLDPYFQQIYLYVQAYLSWVAKMPERAIDLLEISARHRTWDWRPGYYIGFNYYFFLNDLAKASKAFMEAGKIKEAPVILPLLGARFAAKAGRTQAALLLLESMLTEPTMPEDEKKELSQRIQALRGVTYLEKAIALYKERIGTFPDNLEALIKEGIIEKMPPNPYDSQYFYDKGSGKVTFDKVGEK